MRSGFTLVAVAIAVSVPQAVAGDQIDAVNGLVSRLLPGMEKNFTADLWDPSRCGGSSGLCFGYSAIYGQVALGGTTGVELAMALNHYLKYVANCSISWKGTGGNQLSLTSLPSSPPVHVDRAHKLHYYSNVVTFSYSFVWYTYDDWVREIDWMALNGVNLPLAYTGQEKVYQKVFTAMGVTVEELEGYFPGPAFLAWGRGQNLMAWGGPLSQDWIDSQWDLQRRILPVMREFGMKPVLPAFQGNVPVQFVKLFPNANVSRIGTCPTPDSNKYGCATWVDVLDPLFNRTADLVLQTVIQDFGTDHYYAADGDFSTALAPWYYSREAPHLPDPHVGDAPPPVNPDIYAHSKGAYASIIRTDPDAIWVYQTWSWLYGASMSTMYSWVSAVPKGRLLLLDLSAEEAPLSNRTQSYFGTPYIWCMLHNFGGNSGMWGDSVSVGTNPVAAAASAGSTMMGTGLTMEGTNQNAMIYEMMNEMAYRGTAVDRAQWAAQWANRRYAVQSDALRQAWGIWMQTIYNAPHYGMMVSKDTLTAIPYGTTWEKLDGKAWYSMKDFVQGWQLMLQGKQDCLTYKHDLVDVTRQALAKYSTAVWNRMNQSIQHGDVPGFKSAAGDMQTLLTDVESILQTVPTFLMGTWTEAAKGLGGGDANKTAQFYANAVQQVTFWSYIDSAAAPNLPGLADYATKHWAGLMTQYHARKWAIFTEVQMTALTTGTAFNKTQYYESLDTWYEAWRAEATFSPTPQGDAHQVASALYNKYSSLVMQTPSDV